jgi:hypothetical protein
MAIIGFNYSRYSHNNSSIKIYKTAVSNIELMAFLIIIKQSGEFERTEESLQLRWKKFLGNVILENFYHSL